MERAEANETKDYSFLSVRLVAMISKGLPLGSIYLSEESDS